MSYRASGSAWRPNYPKEKTGEDYRDIDREKLQHGIEFIESFIPEFDYSDILSDITDNEKLKEWYQGQSNNYFKLQVFRRFLESNGRRWYIKDKSLLKFIAETYHIENDYLYFFDLEKFEIVPDHIIAECDKFFENICN